MKNLNTVYARVSRWNAARCEREYNHDLAMALLREEYTEHLEATERVDHLDALCDIVYVALGVLWKSNVSQAELDVTFTNAFEDVNALVNTNTIMPVYFIGSAIDCCDVDSEYPIVHAMCTIIQLAMSQMTCLVGPHQIMDALLVVCDSNDTKVVQKVDAAKKANAGNKGMDFISPEPRLQILIDNWENENAA